VGARASAVGIQAAVDTRAAIAAGIITEFRGTVLSCKALASPYFKS
jgi:hypothetical protein